MINPQCQIFSSVSNSVLRQAFSASAPRMFTKLSTAVLENLEIVPGQWIKPGVRRVSRRSPWHAIPPAQFLGGISNILLNQSLKLFFLRMSTIGPQHCPGSLWIVRIRTPRSVSGTGGRAARWRAVAWSSRPTRSASPVFWKTRGSSVDREAVGRHPQQAFCPAPGTGTRLLIF